MRASSPRNTQPWRFAVDGPRIEVRLDPDRILPGADSAGWEARLACGAAVCNLVLTLRVNGVRTRLRILPDRSERNLLAVLTLEGGIQASTVDQKLFGAVFRRHTDRRSLLDRPVSAAAQEKSRFAARTEGGQLEFLDASSRYPRVTELLRRAEFAQASDPAFPSGDREVGGTGAGPRR